MPIINPNPVPYTQLDTIDPNSSVTAVYNPNKYPIDTDFNRNPLGQWILNSDGSATWNPRVGATDTFLNSYLNLNLDIGGNTPVYDNYNQNKYPIDTDFNRNPLRQWILNSDGNATWNPLGSATDTFLNSYLNLDLDIGGNTPVYHAYKLNEYSQYRHFPDNMNIEKKSFLTEWLDISLTKASWNSTGISEIYKHISREDIRDGGKYPLFITLPNEGEEEKSSQFQYAERDLDWLTRYYTTPKGALVLVEQAALQLLNPRYETRIFNLLSIIPTKGIINIPRHIILPGIGGLLQGSYSDITLAADAEAFKGRNDLIVPANPTGTDNVIGTNIVNQAVNYAKTIVNDTADALASFWKPNKTLLQKFADRFYDLRTYGAGLTTKYDIDLKDDNSSYLKTIETKFQVFSTGDLKYSKNGVLTELYKELDEKAINRGTPGSKDNDYSTLAYGDIGKKEYLPFTDSNVIITNFDVQFDETQKNPKSYIKPTTQDTKRENAVDAHGYHIGDTAWTQEDNNRNSLDKINALAYGKDLDSTDPALKDFIPFKIHDIYNNKYLIFRAYVSSLAYNFNSSWTSHEYVGRPIPLYTYSGASRTFSISLKTFALSKAEMKPLWIKTNMLAGLAFPHYKNGVMIAPLIKLTLGDIFKATPGFFNTVDIQFNDDIPWELDGKTDYNNAGEETDGSGAPILPFGADIVLNFTVIGNEMPGAQTKHFFGLDISGVTN